MVAPWINTTPPAKKKVSAPAPVEVPAQEKVVVAKTTKKAETRTPKETPPKKATPKKAAPKTAKKTTARTSSKTSTSKGA